MNSTWIWKIAVSFMGCQAHLSLQLDLLYDNLKQLRTRLFFVANTHKRVNTDYYENTHNNIDLLKVIYCMTILQLLSHDMQFEN